MKQNLILVGVISAYLFAMTGLSLFGKTESYSDSERRLLAEFPELSLVTLMDGSFMQDFETYQADHFPARDSFRAVKSFSELMVFGKLDNNDLYLDNGNIAKLDPAVNPSMLAHASERFQFLYDSYLADGEGDLYFSIVPDKHYYLAKENGYLCADYEELIRTMRENTPYLEYIDITGLLGIEDYYATDTHWRQENIVDVAQYLGAQMGVTLQGEYTENRLEAPFYGVYYGQLALPVKPDTLTYLTNDMLSQCTVTSYATGVPKESVLYNMEKAAGKDPYELFLSGSEPLLVIENPNAVTDKELIVFRDSFGSSLIPLLAEGYASITVVDIRYVQSAMLGQLIDFSDQDVLFLYSTLLLNNSLSLK